MRAVIAMQVITRYRVRRTYRSRRWSSAYLVSTTELSLSHQHTGPWLHLRNCNYIRRRARTRVSWRAWIIPEQSAFC